MSSCRPVIINTSRPHATYIRPRCCRPGFFALRRPRDRADARWRTCWRTCWPSPNVASSMVSRSSTHNPLGEHVQAIGERRRCSAGPRETPAGSERWRRRRGGGERERERGGQRRASKTAARRARARTRSLVTNDVVLDRLLLVLYTRAPRSKRARGSGGREKKAARPPDSLSRPADAASHPFTKTDQTKHKQTLKAGFYKPITAYGLHKYSKHSEK